MKKTNTIKITYCMTKDIAVGAMLREMRMGRLPTSRKEITDAATRMLQWYGMNWTDHVAGSAPRGTSEASAEMTQAIVHVDCIYPEWAHEDPRAEDRNAPAQEEE